MSDPIKFYFACVSPWSYLGSDALLEIAEKHGRAVALKPTNVGRTWSETGAGQPLGNRPEVLQSYRLLELPVGGPGAACRSTRNRSIFPHRSCCHPM